MTESLRNKTISSMLWSTFGKFGTMGIQFVTNMVLARLLMPSDYGVIGMLNIFIILSETFIVGGFGQALIQKKNPTHIDYTTVFYWNLIASIILYGVLYAISPTIANFYQMPQLVSLTRIYGLILIISAFSIVQNNLLQKDLKFKTLSLRNITAAFLGTVVSIIMALKGYGVWSLVASHLVNAIVSVILLWKLSNWRPTWAFSWHSFKELFSFGSLMAVSSLVDQFYKEMQGLIIGKWYSATDLGYYSQAKKLENIPTSSLSQIVSQVTFPVFSKLQDNKKQLKAGVRKCTIAVTYLNFPLNILLIVIAAPLINLLYGPNWEQSIIYFQLLNIVGLFYTITTMNNSIIKSLGKSKIFLYMKIIQRIIGLILIFIGASYSIIGLLVGVISSVVLNYIITTFINNKLLNYGLFEQLADVGFSFILALILGVIAYMFVSLYSVCNQYLIMLVQIAFYILNYLFISKIFKVKGFLLFEEIIKYRIFKKNDTNKTTFRN